MFFNKLILGIKANKMCKKKTKKKLKNNKCFKIQTTQ